MPVARLFNLLFIFFLCFACFLFGWAFAVFVLPGQPVKSNLQTVKTSTKEHVPENSQKTSPFFKDLRDNLLILFDPYKMDSTIKKHSLLEKSDSYIKKAKPIQVKAPLTPSVDHKTSFNPNKEKKAEDPSLKPLSLLNSNSLEAETKTKDQKINKKLQKVQEDFDKKNREQLMKIASVQDFFSTDGKFSFLVNGFSEKKKALKYIQDMKKTYPLWSFLIKAHKDHISVYLGPFSSKKKALEFKKSLSHSQPFSSLDFLEEISL